MPCHDLLSRTDRDANAVPRTVKGPSRVLPDEMLAAPFGEACPQGGAILWRQSSILRFTIRSPPDRVGAFPVLVAQHAFQHLLRGGRRQFVRDAHEARDPLRRQVGL